ncbi:hypothetical protein SD77_1671 [Bacillus badius]|uniref:Uncharacterized protein n=1 Tax=Bacillus badius TaxID=1455 RepID=A0ABR5AR39_BACBA|nr:hypothetical protein SD78_2849 [Bacillus badius]KIL77224.1 hypothetical protein SD77_1671 [Bacillus badius]
MEAAKIQSVGAKGSRIKKSQARSVSESLFVKEEEYALEKQG